MSLEEKIDKLTAALEANTAALLGSGGAAPAAEPPKGKVGRPAKDKTADVVKPKHTKEELTQIMQKVASEYDSKTAKEMIKEFGKAEKLAEIDAANFDALYAAAEAKLAEGDGDGDDDSL